MGSSKPFMVGGREIKRRRQRRKTKKILNIKEKHSSPQIMKMMKTMMIMVMIKANR